MKYFVVVDEIYPVIEFTTSAISGVEIEVSSEEFDEFTEARNKFLELNTVLAVRWREERNRRIIKK